MKIAIAELRVIKGGINIANINDNIILKFSRENLDSRNLEKSDDNNNNNDKRGGNLEKSDDNNNKRKKKRVKISMMYAIFLNIMYPPNTALMPSPIMSGLSMSNLSSISSKLLSKSLYS